MKKQRMVVDIPRWFSALILTLLSVAIPIYVYVVNPAFLTSQNGYANGIEMYTHTIEALHIKKLLQNWRSNFWFDGGSLGYPLFIQSQPLPCFFTAVAMVLLERFVSPLCVFRWIVVLLITVLPLAWYKAARNFRFSRIQSISLALFILCIDSQLQTGFELDAVLLHGYLPQLFAMVIMPIAASSIYLYGLHMNTEHQTAAVFYTCLAYLCNINVGFYCFLLLVVTTVLFISANDFDRGKGKEVLKRFCILHIFILIYLLWWIVPLFLSYVYSHTGGTSTSMLAPSLAGLIDLFTSGMLFGYRQNCHWTTLLVAIGLLVAIKNLKGLRKFNSLQFNEQYLFTTWLLMVTALSVSLSIETPLTILFRRMVPCQLNSDPRMYLFGVQFCGMVFASLSVPLFIDILTKISSQRAVKKGISIFVIGLLGLALIKTSAERVSERVTLVEVSEDFLKTLDSIRNISKDGRMIAHEKFGTGGPWDLVNIPYLTEKSGLFLPGSRDSVSTFYLNSLLQSESCTVRQFHYFLNLYNVHFLVASSSTIDSSAIDLSDFKLIHKIYDMQFYQVSSDKYSYNYFEMVRLPGYIAGNLKRIYQPVSETLDLFAKQVLFYINPKEETKKRSIVDACVKDNSLLETLSGGKDLSLVHWHYKEEETNSEHVVSSLKEYYRDRWTTSLIMDEKHFDNEYHVIVHVTASEVPQLCEHLLLKVNYHPFWRCHYIAIDDNYFLEEYDPTVKNQKRKQMPVDHVTPNFMSVTLPPGRYHVIFSYRFPGILKLLAVFSNAVLLDGTFNKRRIMKSLMRCVLLLWSALLLLGSKTTRYMRMLLLVAVASIRWHRYRAIFLALARVLETRYESTIVPYIRKVKMLTYIEDALKKSVFHIYQDCMQEIRGKFRSREIEVEANGGITEFCNDKPYKYDISQDEESSSMNLDRQDNTVYAAVPPNKHVKKSSRKKRMQHLTQEYTLVPSSCDEHVLNPVVSDECIPVLAETFAMEDDRFNEFDSDTSCITPNTVKSFSAPTSKSSSLSPLDDKMATEDCYIYDSDLYNSDIYNNDDSLEGKDHNHILNSDENTYDDDAIPNSDIFQTTWIAEKEEDDDLDMNESLELSFSSLSSGSNTASDIECNLSEFSSSPNEHSSPDDSFEYRKDFEHLEEITQSNRETSSSQSYRAYISDPVHPELYACTVNEVDDNYFLNDSHKSTSCNK